MSAIWKFKLSIADKCIAHMPHGAKVISVQMQDDALCAWAIVNPEHHLIEHPFAIIGTGHTFEISSNCRHLGTVQVHGGSLVFHVFDLLP